MNPTEASTDSFYRAAALGLVWLDARESAPRRFGPAADATWRNYLAQPTVLNELDRLELLIRDAATLYPDAFGPRAVFALEGLTDDEPFGQWLHAPAPGLARDVIRTPPAAGDQVRALLEAAAREWSLAPTPAPALPSIGPTTRVICAGPGALIAIAAHFEAHRALDLTEQLTVVTDSPALRQLAGLAGMAIGTRAAPRVIPPATTPEALRALGVTRLDAAVVSADAAPAERACCELLLAAFGR